MTGFEPYQPAMWYVDGLLVNAPAHQKPLNQLQKRSSGWKVAFIASKLCFGISVASSLLLIPSISASTDATFADYHEAIPLSSSNTPGVAIAHSNKSETIDSNMSRLEAINKPFATLFDAFKKGEKLIPSEEIRHLADQAARLRNERVDINAWATKLSEDIKDAGD